MNFDETKSPLSAAEFSAKARNGQNEFAKSTADHMILHANMEAQRKNFLKIAARSSEPPATRAQAKANADKIMQMMRELDELHKDARRTVLDLSQAARAQYESEGEA